MPHWASAIQIFVLGLFQKKLPITKSAVLNNCHLLYFTWVLLVTIFTLVQCKRCLFLLWTQITAIQKLSEPLKNWKKILKKIRIYILSYLTVFIEHFILLQKTGSKENLFPTFLLHFLKLFGYRYPNELGKCFWEAVLKHQKLMALVFSDLFCGREPKNHIELVSVYPTFWKQPRSIHEVHCTCILLTLVSCWKSGTI